VRTGRRLVLDESMFVDDPTDFRTICHTLNPVIAAKMPESVYDLLDKCLSLNPRDRISASEALQHAFLRYN
jgi:serine/threonine protein kinase